VLIHQTQHASSQQQQPSLHSTFHSPLSLSTNSDHSTVPTAAEPTKAASNCMPSAGAAPCCWRPRPCSATPTRAVAAAGPAGRGRSAGGRRSAAAAAAAAEAFAAADRSELDTPYTWSKGSGDQGHTPRQAAAGQDKTNAWHRQAKEVGPATFCTGQAPQILAQQALISLQQQQQQAAQRGNRVIGRSLPACQVCQSMPTSHHTKQAIQPAATTTHAS